MTTTRYGMLDSTIAAAVRQIAQLHVEHLLCDLEEMYQLLDEIIPVPWNYLETHPDESVEPSGRWKQAMIELFGPEQSHLMLQKLPTQFDLLRMSKQCPPAMTTTIATLMSAVGLFLISEAIKLEKRINNSESAIDIEFVDSFITKMYVSATTLRRHVKNKSWPVLAYSTEYVYRNRTAVVRADQIRIGDSIDISDWKNEFVQVDSNRSGSRTDHAYHAQLKRRSQARNRANVGILSRSPSSSPLSNVDRGVWVAVVDVEYTKVAVDIKIVDQDGVPRWLAKVDFSRNFLVRQHEAIRTTAKSTARLLEQ